MTKRIFLPWKYTVFLVYTTLNIFLTATSVEWTLGCSYVLFGEDVRLNCAVPKDACSKKAPRQWSGGEGYKVLCLDGWCSENDKYSMEIYNNSLNFSLTVKNFTESDLNWEYTCMCGVSQYTENLTVDKVQIVYAARNNNIIDNSYVSDNELYVTAVLHKVYPVPNCSLELNGEQKVIAYKEIKNGTLYTIVFNSTFQINLLGKSCSIQLDLKCIAAMESRSILRRDFNVCNDDSPNYMLIIILVMVSVLLGAVLVLLCLLRRKIPSIKGKSNRQAEDHQNELQDLSDTSSIPLYPQETEPQS